MSGVGVSVPGKPTSDASDTRLRQRADAMGVVLRRARPDDADDFVAMMNDDAVHPQLMQMPYTDASFWRERLQGNTGGSEQMDLSLVVQHENRVVASAGLHVGRALVRRRHVMQMGISVAKDWQGRGAGDLLMSALCHHADHWLGVTRLELDVFVDNARAIALYRKHGFELEGTHLAYAMRDGVLVDSLSMARLHPSLGRAPTATGSGAQNR